MGGFGGRGPSPTPCWCGRAAAAAAPPSPADITVALRAAVVQRTGPKAALSRAKMATDAYMYMRTLTWLISGGTCEVRVRYLWVLVGN